MSMPIYPSIHLSIHGSIYPSIHLSIHPSIHLIEQASEVEHSRSKMQYRRVRAVTDRQKTDGLRSSNDKLAKCADAEPRPKPRPKSPYPKSTPNPNPNPNPNPGPGPSPSFNPNPSPDPHQVRADATRQGPRQAGDRDHQQERQLGPWRQGDVDIRQVQGRA